MRVGSWKRVLSGLFLVFSLFTALGAMAEAAPQETEAPLPAPFVGYYEMERRIRVSPHSNTDPLVAVPENTPIYLTPVNDRYAETRYEGVTGYIFYQDAIPALGENTPVAPYVAYSGKAVSAYAHPHFSGEVADSFPANTPFEIKEENGFFAVITREDGFKLYIPLRSLSPIVEDTNVPAYRAYLSKADVLYRFPLANAPVDMVLPMSAEVLVSAANGEYAYVNYGTRSGYVLLSLLETAPAHKSSAFFAYTPLPTVLYEEPSLHAYTERYVDVGIVLEIDGSAGSFSYAKNLDAYVLTDSLKKLEVSILRTPFVAYWETEQPLYQSAHGSMARAGFSLAANIPVDILHSFSGGTYYLVQVEGQWGFVPKAGMITVKTTTYAKSSVFVARKGIASRANPIPGEAEGEALSQDVVLKVSESFNGFVRIQDGPSLKYVAYDDLERVEDTKKVSSYEAYLPTDARILEVPHVAGKEIATVSGNRLVRIGQQNSGYAYVSFGEVKGYVTLDNVWKMNSLPGSGEEAQKYYIFLNKATRELTVYYADQDGNRTDRVARETVIVAIGKKTTPTPAGIFELGQRERWHYFGPSFVPYAIKYAPGRYLHGPLYYSSNEGSIMHGRLADFGKAVTGGCIRTPYDDMLWIYCHCMNNNTVLEIVNGA